MTATTKQLLARPDADQAKAMYVDQLTRVREALEKIAPNVSWSEQPPTPSRQNLCATSEGETEDAISFGYSTGGGGAIPDEDWDQAVKAAMDVLRPGGFTKVNVLADNPGHHEVAFLGRYDSVITLSGDQSTVLSLTSSGCFLTAKAHAAARQNN